MESPYEVESIPAGDLSYMCGLKVAIQFGKSKTNHYCMCRGLSQAKFLILQTPAGADPKRDLQAGEMLIFRYVYNGTVWGFKVTIIQALEQPFRLILARYPEMIERFMLRTCERVDVIIQAEYTLSEHTDKAIIRDLSCGGCRLIIDVASAGELFSKGDDQEGILSFSTDALEETVTVGFGIVRIKSDKNKTELGIAFDFSDSETIDRITQYVDHILEIQA